MLQCAAVCCSPLQCVAYTTVLGLYVGSMNCQVIFARVLHTSEPSSVLQCVAVCCSVFQFCTVCCSVTFARVLRRIKPICHKDLRLPFERVTGPQMSPTYSQKSHTYSWANKGLRTPPPTRVPSLYKTRKL